MAEFTDYLENELLDHAFGKGARAWTAPTNLYLVLLTGAMTDALDTYTQLNELTGTGYAPAAITFGAATGTTPTLTSNTNTITFTNSGTPTWTAVSGIAICSGNATNPLASSAVLCYDTDMTNATIAQNEKLQFQAGDIDISLD